MDVMKTGYRVGTPYGRIKELIPFSDVEIRSTSSSGSDSLNVEDIPSGVLTRKKLETEASVGHPGIANLKCSCTKGVCRSCVCRRKKFDCSSHCSCNPKRCSNSKH